MTKSDSQSRLDLGGPGPLYRCLHCFGHIQSLNRWNMVSCKCGKSAVDGGNSYTKGSFSDLPPEPVDIHKAECGAWSELECSCDRRWDDYRPTEDSSIEETLPTITGDEEDYLGDEYEPPIRRSKQAKPKFIVDNRGIFDVARKMISRYGKKKK